MARRSARSWPEANGESPKELLLDGLCASCSKIPFEHIFQSPASKNTFQYPLGRLDALRERQRTCRFCWFLTSIHEHIFSPFLRDAGHVPASRNLLYLVSQSSGKPWFDVAGTKAAELPRVPIAWLQLKQDGVKAKRLMEPYVCISRLPDTPCNANDVQSKVQFALPRMRLSNEALRASVNYRLIQEWLDICEKTHTELCGRNSISFKRDFLDMNLIDVQNRRIVPDIKSDPYIALSYVWGPDRANKSKATKAPGRKRPREAPGANTLYDKLPEHVPKTIQDAMEFVEQLGLKYLWVDCYCVDQSDYEAKQAQIENMHLVFECAYLTIVALDAQNMEEGLSGLSRPLKYTYQPEVEVPSGRYMATFVDSIWDNQGNLPWDLRAWTLQEALLSRRCLYFDRSHVYMICEQEMFHDIMEADEREDRIPTVQSSSFYWQNGFDIILRDEIWHQTTYGAFVDCFTRRNLTFQHDALNACRAALTQMTLATGVGFLWGLPLKGLARALLWQPDPYHCLQRRDFFPSWTWLGWVGRICYWYWLEEVEDYAEEVETRLSNDKGNNNIQHDRPMADSLFRHDVRQNDEAAIHIKRTSETDETRVLRISSTMARFDMKLVRHDEHRDSERVSLGQELSCRRKGDQWTLLNRRGETLVNEVGEEEKFERTDYFFRLHPVASKAIQKTEAKNEFVFVKYWPAIRDHHKSNNWLPDMVSALLVVRNKDGRTYRREASVIMKCTDWLAARPIPRVIELR